MKAVVLVDSCSVVYTDVETPKADSEHSLIKVNKVGICGSDVHMWRMGLPDWILGHEYCGVLEDPGPLAGRFKKGDRVTSITLNPDFTCDYCRKGDHNYCLENAMGCPGSGLPGACADYFAARADLIRKVPDNMSDEETAMLEPTAVAYHAVKKANLKPTDKVLITGTATIGALVAEFVRYFGAKYVVGMATNMVRANRLVEFGVCDAVFNSTDPNINEQLREASGGGFDVYFDCTGVSKVINNSLGVLKKGSTVILVGTVATDTSDLVLMNVILGEHKLFGSYAYTCDDFDKVMSLVEQKKVNTQRYASKTFKLSEMQAAFQYLEEKAIPDFKVFVTP